MGEARVVDAHLDIDDGDDSIVPERDASEDEKLLENHLAAAQQMRRLSTASTLDRLRLAPLDVQDGHELAAARTLLVDDARRHDLVAELLDARQRGGEAEEAAVVNRGERRHSGPHRIRRQSKAVGGGRRRSEAVGGGRMQSEAVEGGRKNRRLA